MPATATGFNIQRITFLAVLDGDNTVIPAPGANKAILVLGGRMRGVGAAGVVTVKSGAAGTVHADFTATAAAPGGVLTFGDSSPDTGVFQVDTNNPLVVNNAAGVDTGGFLAYRIINIPV